MCWLAVRSSSALHIHMASNLSDLLHAELKDYYARNALSSRCGSASFLCFVSEEKYEVSTPVCLVNISLFVYSLRETVPPFCMQEK